MQPESMQLIRQIIHNAEDPTAEAQHTQPTPPFRFPSSVGLKVGILSHVCDSHVRVSGMRVWGMWVKE